MFSDHDKYVIGGILVLLLTSFLGVSCWTDRTLDFWLSHFKGQEVDCPFILSAALTLVLNGAAIVLNVISEIARLYV